MLHVGRRELDRVPDVRACVGGDVRVAGEQRHAGGRALARHGPVVRAGRLERPSRSPRAPRAICAAGRARRPTRARPGRDHRVALRVLRLEPRDLLGADPGTSSARNSSRLHVGGEAQAEDLADREAVPVVHGSGSMRSSCSSSGRTGAASMAALTPRRRPRAAATSRAGSAPARARRSGAGPACASAGPPGGRPRRRTRTAGPSRRGGRTRAARAGPGPARSPGRSRSRRRCAPRCEARRARRARSRPAPRGPGPRTEPRVWGSGRRKSWYQRPSEPALAVASAAAAIPDGERRTCTSPPDSGSSVLSPAYRQ